VVAAPPKRAAFARTWLLSLDKANWLPLRTVSVSTFLFDIDVMADPP
jgi:hypothetical protein